MLFCQFLLLTKQASIMIYTKSDPYLEVCDVYSKTDKQIEKYLANADYYIKSRVKRLTNELKKKTSICANALRKKMVKKYYNICYRNEELIFSPNGKPEYMGNNAVKFSVSHSGHYVAAAVSKFEVGVDIQIILKCNSKIVNYWFNDDEKIVIKNSLNKDVDFTIIWTKKEAYLKLIGGGLCKNFNEVDYSNVIFNTWVTNDYVLTMAKFFGE